MKSVFKLLKLVFKYGAVLAVIINTGKVLFDELQHKFPELLEDEDDPDQTGKPAAAPVAEEKKKGVFGLKLPWT